MATPASFNLFLWGSIVRIPLASPLLCSQPSRRGKRSKKPEVERRSATLVNIVPGVPSSIADLLLANPRCVYVAILSTSVDFTVDTSLIVLAGKLSIIFFSVRISSDAVQKADCTIKNHRAWKWARHEPPDSPRGQPTRSRPAVRVSGFCW